jgi:type IV secretory pathway VirB4 component
MFKFYKTKKQQIDKIDDFNSKYPITKLYEQNGMKIESTYIEQSNRISKSYYLVALPNITNVQDVISAFDLTDKIDINNFQFFLKLNISLGDDHLLFKTIKTTKMNITEQVKVPIVGGSEIEAKTHVDNIEYVEDLVSKGQELCDTAMVLTVFANTKEHLNDIDKHIQSRLRQKKWVFASPTFDQKNTFLNSLPIPTYNPSTIKVLSQPLSILLLPTTTRNGGLLPIGYNEYKKNLYFLDVFKGDRTHSISVTGDNGGGKSAFCKKLFEELGLFGVQRWYIDPEGECAKLASEIGSEVIQVNRAKGINIIDYNENIHKLFDSEDREKYNPKADHINWLADFMLNFPVFDNSLLNNRTPLLACLSSFYNEVGITQNQRNMEELCNYLRSHPKSNNEWKECWLGIKNFSSVVEDHATYGGYFGAKEPFRLDSDSTILDISGNENEIVRSALGYALLYKTFEMMLPKDRYRCLFIDELHMFMKFKGFTDLLTQYAKRCRKYNGFYTLITQELNDYVKYDALSISKQIGFQFIFAQEDIKPGIITISKYDSKAIRSMLVGTCMVWQKKENNMEKIKIHLRQHQIEYSAKDSSKDLSIDMFRKYKSE